MNDIENNRPTCPQCDCVRHCQGSSEPCPNLLDSYEALAPPECEGGCWKHHGEVETVRVAGWGTFDYCQTAIAEVRRRGLSVKRLELV
jgi:hypothetical protein